jgi:hypothetical protein
MLAGQRPVKQEAVLLPDEQKKLFISSENGQ